MIERCPCCNARLKQAIICPRCRADLNTLIKSEKSAQFWLTQSVQYLIENKIGQSSFAINLSLRLKRTKMAITFRDFLIHQQCKNILDLLAQTQLLSAKKALYHARELMPYNKQLQQLDAFTNYLLIKNESK